MDKTKFTLGKFSFPIFFFATHCTYTTKIKYCKFNYNIFYLQDI
jgi:hypothetical protein